MRKPRILFVGEASYLATGYSTYGLAVQKVLSATGKYELAELACYHDPSDPNNAGKVSSLPWKFYSNIPSDPARLASYDPKSSHQFGEFAFNDVLLDFKPDVVWTIRDWWMDNFVERSPFRKMFHWAHMPTVDAEPQPENWLSTYANADSVLCYSDWGVKVLKRDGGGKVNVLGSAPPCADTAVFAPMESEPLRDRFGIPRDALVVGTVMRNQGRKLYPDLIRAFARFLELADPDTARRSLLYLHASYPEKKGWDIPRLIKRSGISHKILVTYKCVNCKETRASRYADARAFCPFCNALASGMPHVRNGVSTQELAGIYNCFDAYVQFANSEGFGLPQVEAAACGVPVFATDYSAMSDVVRKVNGYPIKVERLTEDIEFGCLRATPCPEDLAQALLRHFNLGESMRLKKRAKAREGVLQNYSWERTADQWMRVFDEARPSLSWDAPPRTVTPGVRPASFTSNESLVRWALEHHLGRPDLLGSYTENCLTRDLNWGSRQGPDGGFVDFDADVLLKELADAREVWNDWETKRTNEGA